MNTAAASRQTVILLIFIAFLLKFIINLNYKSGEGKSNRTNMLKVYNADMNYCKRQNNAATRKELIS